MIFLIVAVTIKIILLFVLAWSIRLVMDEFVQLGWAKYLFNGLFDTIWHPKAVGYAAFYEVAHLIGWNATSILLVAAFRPRCWGARSSLWSTHALARLGGSVRALRSSSSCSAFRISWSASFAPSPEPPGSVFRRGGAAGHPARTCVEGRQLVAAGVLSGLAFLAPRNRSTSMLLSGSAWSLTQP